MSFADPQAPSLESTSYFREFVGIFNRFREAWAILGKREKRFLLLSTLPMLFHSLTQNAIPVLAGQMVDKLQTAHQASGLQGGEIATDWLAISLRFMVLIGVFALAREIFFLVRKRLVSTVCTRVERNLTIGLVSHLFRQSLQSLSKDHVGTMHGKATRGIRSFTHFIRLSFREFLPAVFAVLVSLAIAFYQNSLVGGLLLVALFTAIALVVWQLNSQKGMYAALGKSQEALDGKIIEQLEGMEYIRAANTLGIEVGRVASVADTREQCDRRLWVRSSIFDILKALNEWFFLLAVLALTIYLAAIGKIEIGKIVAFLGIVTNMTNPLRDMHRILDDAYETSGSLKDLMGIMDELMDPSFAIDPDQEMTILRRFGERRPPPPKIEFREPVLSSAIPLLETENLVVEFGAGKSRRRVLDGITQQIKLGETVGFAGPSGSGKSTLLKVLMRLVPSATGIAKFGGVPIQNVSRDAIGRLIGYVSQNPFVFSGTVAENIAYGCKPSTPQEIEAAAIKAGIHEEILAMPMGYETQLRERGSNISGGQRQRIAIARIFLKDPPILIFDEGTSALDNVSEQVVQGTLELLPNDRTILLVAHRLSTLRSADRILVFERGRIVQCGKMDDLAAEAGIFRELMKISEAE
jgi:ATP-binding cassette, subfamily B, bacterial